ALVEIEHRLPRARIEAHLIGLGKQALPVAHETQLGERRLEALVERVHRGERLTDLPDRGAGVEQRPCRSERQQVTERIAGVAVEEAETLQLRRPSRCQRQDAHDLAEPVDSLARSVHQCRKCRRPVTTIATSCSSAAATTSSSRNDPPGWITAVAPACARTSSPSRNGKNASDAATAPRGSRPASRARDRASRAEASRFICPAPIPI